VYKKAYIVGAAVIACTAVTVALFIFFKLREKWMNQWYKRLGCAMLMAIAVCGRASNKLYPFTVRLTPSTLKACTTLLL
jgi:multidrug efflux pump subunit AcrB